MRIRLSLSVKKHSIIPINYNGHLNAWIYKVIFNTNQEFGEWLHESGVGEDSKQYKLFTFSSLQFRPFEINQQTQQIKINTTKVQLTISFYLNDAIRHFVTGLFQRQQFSIGDNWNAPVDFTVDFVEVLPEPSFSETMQFRALQPICISKQLAHKKHGTYLSPVDDGYETLFLKNLLKRYHATQSFFGKPVDTVYSPADFKFQHIGRVQRKLFTYKTNSKSENKVAGYKYDFKLTAPVELIKLGYYGGFGEKGSQGFGYVRIR